jgi:hypothetical protein
MWNGLGNDINGLPIVFNLKIISFGILQNSWKSDVINFIIYLMKSYIFQQKNRQKLPSFKHFLSYLKLRITIEIDKSCR